MRHASQRELSNEHGEHKDRDRLLLRKVPAEAILPQTVIQAQAGAQEAARQAASCSTLRSKRTWSVQAHPPEISVEREVGNSGHVQQDAQQH